MEKKCLSYKSFKGYLKAKKAMKAFLEGFFGGGIEGVLHCKVFKRTAQEKLKFSVAFYLGFQGERLH